MRIKLGLVAIISGATLACGECGPLEAPTAVLDLLAVDPLPKSDPPGSGSIAVPSAAVWTLPNGGLSPLAGIRSMGAWLICTGEAQVMAGGVAICVSRLSSGSCLRRLVVFLELIWVVAVVRIAADTGWALGTGGVLPAAC